MVYLNMRFGSIKREVDAWRIGGRGGQDWVFG